MRAYSYCLVGVCSGFPLPCLFHGCSAGVPGCDVSGVRRVFLVVCRRGVLWVCLSVLQVCCGYASSLLRLCHEFAACVGGLPHGCAGVCRAGGFPCHGCAGGVPRVFLVRVRAVGVAAGVWRPVCCGSVFGFPPATGVPGMCRGGAAGVPRACRKNVLRVCLESAASVPRICRVRGGSATPVRRGAAPGVFRVRVSPATFVPRVFRGCAAGVPGCAGDVWGVPRVFLVVCRRGVLWVCLSVLQVCCGYASSLLRVCHESAAGGLPHGCAGVCRAGCFSGAQRVCGAQCLLGVCSGFPCHGCAGGVPPVFLVCVRAVGVAAGVWRPVCCGSVFGFPPAAGVPGMCRGGSSGSIVFAFC